ncbi:cytidine deaminase-like protein [Mycena sp. CBHHK59/15]|nr:cytidine deaminase-like protein [Mycena sp. CBHHK59/15]
MALALGLGSLFNHSNSPNVSYTIDSPGPNLKRVDNDDGWGGLSKVDVPQTSRPSFFDGAVDDIVPEEELPFEKLKPPPEEETLEDIRTVQVWAVDVPDPRSIGPMLKWLRQNELDEAELGHLKRVRKQGDKSTFLLTASPVPPSLPPNILLPDPFLATVPSSVALTPSSLSLKSLLWPTVYAPRRKGEVEDWSQGKARWAWEAMHVAVREALRSRAEGELPIAAYHMAHHQPPRSLDATRDIRLSPLRHAIMNIIRQIADHRAHSEVESAEAPPPPLEDVYSPRNGTNYLLTSQTLFTTHEPCIMCSMALLHSRVREVVYLIPMERTGGCGGAMCLPTLPGVNHRFSICRWKGGTIEEEGLHLDASMDA